MVSDAGVPEVVTAIQVNQKEITGLFEGTNVFAALLLAITFQWNFEGGSLGKVETVSESYYRCAVNGESDHEGRNRQATWYYFRIDGGMRRQLTIDLVDLVGEYNYQPGTHGVTKDTRPVYSYDGKIWKFFDDVEWNEAATNLRIRFTPEHQSVWIAHIPPYTNRDLANLLRDLQGHPYLQKESIGKSVGGRDILLLTVTNPAIPENRKRVIWLMARQHAWEAGTSWVVEGALRYLLSSEAGAARLRDECIFKVNPMADPDGVARGGVRYNANGYDLNRNWDIIDPKLMPEIYALRRTLWDWVDSGHQIDLFVTLHNQEIEDLIEGLIGEGGIRFKELAERLSTQLKSKTTFYSPTGLSDSGLDTTSGLKGRMTVDQALLRDRRIPAFLLELSVEQIPALGHPPTIPDRLEFGAGLVQAMASVVLP